MNRYDNANRLTNVTQGRFTAREDDGTGLYYYRARYFQPTLGRFVSEDPLDLSDGRDMYAYDLDAPLDLVDPLGLFSVGGELFVGIGLSLDVGYASGKGWFGRWRFGYGLSVGAGVNPFDNGITPRDCPQTPPDPSYGNIQTEWQGRYWQGGLNIGPVSIGGGRTAGTVRYYQSYKSPYSNDFLQHDLGESTYSESYPYVSFGKTWKLKAGFSKGVEWGGGEACQCQRK